MGSSSCALRSPGPKPHWGAGLSTHSTFLVTGLQRVWKKKLEFDSKPVGECLHLPARMHIRADRSKTYCHRRPELSMGPLCVTQSNPTHQLIDPTRPDPIQLTNLTAWRKQILSNRALNALTWSFQIFSTFAIVDPTQPTENWKISTQHDPTQPNPRVNATHGQLCRRPIGWAVEA